MKPTGQDRGAAAVEFAIILPLVLLLIGGIVDLGRAFYTEVAITNAAREGARAAMFSTTSNLSSVQTRAFSALGGTGGRSPGPNYSVTLATACTSTSGPDATATVIVAYNNFAWFILKPAMNLFGGGSVLPAKLTGSATMQCGG